LFYLKNETKKETCGFARVKQPAHEAGVGEEQQEELVDADRVDKVEHLLALVRHAAARDLHVEQQLFRVVRLVAQVLVAKHHRA